MRPVNDELAAKILTAAEAEFLSKGYRGASVRNIAASLGVTTGAIYRYYAGKEALFDALVKVHYDTVMNKFIGAQDRFETLPPENQRDNMGRISGDCMDWITDYIYKNFNAFKLILSCSEGTKYEHMIHNMVETEVSATHKFAKSLEGLGYPKYEVDPRLEHMLCSGLFSAFFELVVHDIPYKKAKEYVSNLRDFYTAGWQKIMGF